MTIVGSMIFLDNQIIWHYKKKYFYFVDKIK